MSVRIEQFDFDGLFATIEIKNLRSKGKISDRIKYKGIWEETSEGIRFYLQFMLIFMAFMVI